MGRPAELRHPIDGRWREEPADRLRNCVCRFAVRQRGERMRIFGECAGFACWRKRVLHIAQLHVKPVSRIWRDDHAITCTGHHCWIIFGDDDTRRRRLIRHSRVRQHEQRRRAPAALWQLLPVRSKTVHVDDSRSEGEHDHCERPCRSCWTNGAARPRGTSRATRSGRRDGRDRCRRSRWTDGRERTGGSNRRER
jgi:hypothetical protein